MVSGAYKALSTTAIDASKMLSSQTLLGVTGTINLANLVAANIKDTVVIGGVTGSYGPACTLDGASGCMVDGTNYKAAKLANFTAADVKSGVSIGSISGSLATCADGGTGCVVVGPTLKAATAAAIVAGNVKSGVTIAGVLGAYPSATYPLASSTLTTDLPAFASLTGGSTYEWFQSDGTRLTGTVTVDQSVTAATADQVLNSGVYRQVTVVGSPNLTAANIKMG